MNDSSFVPAFHHLPNDFTSLDCEILVIDGPGGTTVRPPSPQLLKLAQAERARIDRWEEQLRRTRSDNKLSDSVDFGSGGRPSGRE